MAALLRLLIRPITFAIGLSDMQHVDDVQLMSAVECQYRLHKMCFGILLQNSVHVYYDSDSSKQEPPEYKTIQSERYASKVEKPTSEEQTS